VPTTASSAYSNLRLDPLRGPQDVREVAINIAPSLTLPAGTILGELTGTTDVQNLHASAAITAGTYTVSDGTNTTAAINYNDPLATINAKLLAATPGPMRFSATGGPLTAPTDIVFTASGGGVYAALTVTPTGITGGVLSVVHTTTGTTGTPGVFKAYAAGNTDGSQVPKLILVYPVTTDASGNITFGTATGGGEFGQTYKSCPAYENGVFKTTDLAGLDANAVTVMGAMLTDGTLASGTIRIG